MGVWEVVWGPVRPKGLSGLSGQGWAVRTTYRREYFSQAETGLHVRETQSSFGSFPPLFIFEKLLPFSFYHLIHCVVFRPTASRPSSSNEPGLRGPSLIVNPLLLPRFRPMNPPHLAFCRWRPPLRLAPASDLQRLQPPPRRPPPHLPRLQPRRSRVPDRSGSGPLRYGLSPWVGI